MGNELKTKILGIIGVRKFIALTLTIVFSYMSVVGIIGKEEFLPVFSMVVGYYFGRSTALDKQEPYHDEAVQLGADHSLDTLKSEDAQG